MSGEPAFVGRMAELAELEQLLSGACEGRGGCLLVAGEPGIGKTTLCSQFAERARRRGARVLWGRAWEWGGAPAFWPWLQVLRALAPETGGDPRGAPEEARDLPWPQSGASGDRFALFDALAERLRRAAQIEPLLIVLEDLHAADVPTLLLLRFAVEQLADAPLLLLGTWRTVEASPCPDALELLADLSRRVRTLDLRGLSVAEVGEWIGRHQRGADPSHASLLSDRTGGNPLLLCSLLQSEANGEAGGGVPLRARAAVERRVSRLDPQVRGVLSAAAVIGREMAVLLLAQVCELPLERVLAAVQVLRAERIFIERTEAPGRYGFVHGLFREVVYAELSPALRLSLHRTAGAALEALYGADRHAHLPELARHFLAVSPDPERGFDYACAAAEYALRSLAYEDAVRYYRQALSACEGPRSAPRQLGEVWLRLGEAQALSGATSAARDSYRRAHQLARDSADFPLEARAAGAFSRLVGFGRSDDEAVRWLTQALEPAHPPAIRVRLLCALLDRLWVSPAAQTRLHGLADEALALARSSGDLRLQAESLAATMVFVWTVESAQLERYRARSAELLQLAQSMQDAELAVEAQRWRFTTAMVAGEIEAAKAALDAYEQLGAQLARPQLGFNALLRRFMLAVLEGRFEDAQALLPAVARHARRAGDPQAQFLELALALDLRRARGDTLSEADIEGLDEQIGRNLPPAARVAIRACLEAEVGQHAAARRSFDQYLELARGMLAGGGQLALANASGAVWQLRDPERATALLPLLEPYEELVFMAGAIQFLGPGSLHLGLVSAAAGQTRRAAALLTKAIAALDRMGARPLAEQARNALQGLDGAPSSTGAALAPSAHPGEAVPGVFSADGDFYRVGIDGKLARIRSSKGLGWIELLLRREGREVHVLELAGSALYDRGCAEPVLDARAKAEYRARLGTLRAEIDDADSAGDLGRAERAREELEALTAALSQATGLGGRDRPSGNAERARARVTLAIRRAIKSLEAVHPALGAHLAAAISTGSFCVYRPDPRARVLWELTAGVDS